MNQYNKCKICSSKIELINPRYNLVICSKCKLVFCNDIFEEEMFSRIYDKLYNQTKQYSTHIKESDDLISKNKYKLGRTKSKVLNKAIKVKNPKVLEIGAGVGVVANFLQSKGIDYLGIEIDKKTVERAKKANLNIKQGDFKSLNKIEDTFDIILAFEVFEHLQDLGLLFKILEQKIKPDGTLGFTVPNFNKYLNYKNLNNKIYQSGPPIHLNFFTVESLQNIAKIYGFEIVLCYEKKYPYFNWKKKETYNHILKSLLGTYRGPTIIAIFKKR
ncbi:class I SAM-dependent methyltransferase [Aequorivita marina]|uniref:class I SAM-dependent methyltransferase n=1 Tax=Aequorivita marina TaxID=3073654 RepID=UPI002876A2CB|nr:class I SAM-dependent methyltransferase [Aequorivita sp. S2608]MDS1298037.1 class I SAM-dependent methyltransferase [Aequorivita sp. S2608]